MVVIVKSGLHDTARVGDVPPNFKMLQYMWMEPLSSCTTSSTWSHRQ